MKKIALIMAVLALSACESDGPKSLVGTNSKGVETVMGHYKNKGQCEKSKRDLASVGYPDPLKCVTKK